MYGKAWIVPVVSQAKTNGWLKPESSKQAPGAPLGAREVDLGEDLPPGEALHHLGDVVLLIALRHDALLVEQVLLAQSGEGSL